MQLPAGSSQGAQLTFECNVHFSVLFVWSLCALGRRCKCKFQWRLSFSIYASDASLFYSTPHVEVSIDKRHQELTFASDGSQVRVMK